MIIDRNGRVTINEQPLGFRFETALLYAFRLHARQKRKGTPTPYFGHLLGVTALVIEVGGDEDQAIAALLHDAVEDQGGEPTLRAIRSLFGEHVATIVQHCSDDDPDSGERSKENWHVRKERYLESLHDAPVEVLRVSLADKLYNARTILRDLRAHGDDLWGRFNHGKKEQLWYYRGLVDAFRRSGHVGELASLVDELDLVVREIGRLADA